MVDGGNDKKSKTPSPFEGRDGDRNDENKENMQSNGLIQNGLDEENVFRYSFLEFHRKTSITTMHIVMLAVPIIWCPSLMWCLPLCFYTPAQRESGGI